MSYLRTAFGQELHNRYGIALTSSNVALDNGRTQFLPPSPKYDYLITANAKGEGELPGICRLRVIDEDLVPPCASQKE